MSPKEVAEFCGVSLSAVRKWMGEGKIPYLKLGESEQSLVRFRAEDVEAFVKERTYGN